MGALIEEGEADRWGRGSTRQRERERRSGLGWFSVGLGDWAGPAGLVSAQLRPVFFFWFFFFLFFCFLFEFDSF